VPEKKLKSYSTLKKDHDNSKYRRPSDAHAITSGSPETFYFEEVPVEGDELPLYGQRLEEDFDEMVAMNPELFPEFVEAAKAAEEKEAKVESHDPEVTGLADGGAES
jgi:hypothetical protein